MPKSFGIKQYMPRTLFGRSLVILVVPVILIQLITTYIFFDRHWTKMTTRLAFAVAGEITVLSEVYESDKRQADFVVKTMEEKLALFPEYTAGAKLGHGQKRSLGFIWESIVAYKLTKELRSMVAHEFLLDVDFTQKWVRVDVQLDGGVLSVGFPQRRLFSSSGYIFILWMIGTSFLLLAIAILFMRNQIRPIRKLAVAAERLGKGRDVPSFKPQGAREVRAAADAFLKMHKRIKRQVEQRTLMLAGVSHDLRTPLTRLKLQIEMLGDSPDIDAMRSDIAEMDKMIAGYLDFVRGEGDEGNQFVSLNALLDKVVSVGKHQGLEASHNLEEDLMINVRPMAFERCLTNLVSNAAKYAKGVWISVAVGEDKKLYITIEDDGPGLPDDQYEEVFKPFYRVDSSRNVNTGGIGLGLPIVMDIIHSHGGKIALRKSEAYGGLRADIALPL